MKKVFIIGNWKSYKNSAGTKEWFTEINNYIPQGHLLHRSGELSITNEKEVILCVPFTVLALAKSLVEQYQLPIQLGAQDISPFDEGKYTGEINGKQIKEFADYVIIGHSERRKYFSEDESMVNRKIEEAITAELTPIVCVSEMSQVRSLPDQKNMIIAYEPLFAIGSGKPDSPENAEKISAEIQAKMENISIIYGGSVTSENVHSFTSMPTISGVLPGGASLNAQEFAAIITNA